MLPTEWLTRDVAAAYVGLRPKSLANKASEGTGPRFKKLGAGRSGPVRYRKEWLDEWVMNNGVAPEEMAPERPRRGRPPKVW